MLYRLAIQPTLIFLKNLYLDSIDNIGFM